MNRQILALVFLCLIGVTLSASNRHQQRPKTQQSQRQSAADESDLTDECPEPNGFFADGYQCDKYYECVDGVINEKLCPDGMVFNDYSIQVEKCDLPFNIDCSQRPSLQEPRPTTHCPRLNGYFAHEDEKICDKFYFCVDGKFNMITCPQGLVYNEKTGICTWPDEAKKKHCSSEAVPSERENKLRTKRVAFWKSGEDDGSGSRSAEEGSPAYGSGSIEVDYAEHASSSSKEKKSGEDYSDYPDYGAPASGSYEAAGGSYEDPEFADFDVDFDDLSNRSPASFGDFGSFGLGLIRRKEDRKNEYEDLDDYISAYVSTIGKNPQKASMGMDLNYYERLAEEAAEGDLSYESGEGEERMRRRGRRGPDPAETRRPHRGTYKSGVGSSYSRGGPMKKKPHSPHSSRKYPPKKPYHKSHRSPRIPPVSSPHVLRHVPVHQKAMAVAAASPSVTQPLQLSTQLQSPPHPHPQSLHSGQPLQTLSSVSTLPRLLLPPPPQNQSPVPAAAVTQCIGNCPKVDMNRAQEHPRYPDPEDCQFFYVCINGEVPRRNGCKKGQVFNETTGSCDWPRNVPECKDWYKGILTDEELYALEHPAPKVRNATAAAQRRKRPHQQPL